jgi:MscS family membrane protein
LLIIGGVLELDPGAQAFVRGLASSLVAFAIALFAYKIVSQVFLTRARLYALTGIALEEPLIPFVRVGLQIIIFFITMVVIIQQWGYDVSALLATLGIGGLAISLAAQDTLSNMVAFTAIVGDRPFVVGETIRTKDVEGTVEQVGVRSTRIRQGDQAVVTVPNNMLATSAILNWSRLNKRQINVTVGILYGPSADQLEVLLRRLREMLSEWEKVDKETVVVNLTEFGPDSLKVLVRCFINLADWAQFTQEQERILLQIMRIIDEVGMQIAFPSQRLYIENPSSSVNQLQEPQGGRPGGSQDGVSAQDD